MILGIDEVGRGPWAGPLVVGAVVLDAESPVAGLTDSKKLSPRRRSELDAQVRAQAAGYGLGWVHADELDAVGLSAALRLATRRAVEQVTAPYHEIIIDGTINFLSDTTKGSFVTTLAKADLLIESVSAASIIAKVARDAFMAAQDEQYPGYDFSAHAGYGTAKHRAAIEALGVTPLHRLSFAPLQRYRTAQVDAPPVARAASPTAIGQQAEEQVAQYLQSEGHTIVARNWKTSYCEIDVISRRAGTLYFTEVKYRSSAQQGGGLAAITAQKQQRMKRGAELYLAKSQLLDEPRLAVADVSPAHLVWFALE